MAIDRTTPLGRLQHAIMIEKKLRQQQRDRNEDTTDVTNRIIALRQQAKDIQQTEK